MKQTLLAAFLPKTFLPALAFCLIPFLGVELRASLVNVDFNTPIAHPTLGTYSGAAQIGAPGDIWNGVDIENNNTAAGTGVLSLIDAAGADTGFMLSIAASSDGCCYANAPGWDPYNADSPNYGNLMADMSQGGGLTFTLAGLAPGAYDLWIYTPFGLGNMTANLDSKASLPYDDTDRLLSTHSQLLNPIVLGDGLLSVSSDQRVSGFQLVESAPEPESLVMFALGIALLVGIGRWRQTARPFRHSLRER